MSDPLLKHEVLHISSIFLNNWTDYILNHPYVGDKLELFHLAESIDSLMAQFYQDVSNS